MLAEIMMLDRIPKRVKNIIGTKFGDGCVVVGFVGKTYYKNCSTYHWWALCKCGNEFKVQRKEIFGSHKRKMCFKCDRKRLGLQYQKDMVGKKFYRLTVLQDAGRTKWRSAQFLCQCDCGITKIIKGSSLRSGATKSCGCFNREISRKQCGSKSHNWNSMMTDEERELRKQRRMDKRTVPWRKQIFKRDNYICQCCGYTHCVLNAHHLNSWDKFKDQRYDLCNGITLCANCHKLFHKQYGRGSNTREQYQEFIQEK